MMTNRCTRFQKPLIESVEAVSQLRITGPIQRKCLDSDRKFPAIASARWTATVGFFITVFVLFISPYVFAQTYSAWGTESVIQPEGDMLSTDIKVPANVVSDAGLTLEFGAPSPGATPSIAFANNKYQFATVWYALHFINNGRVKTHVQVTMGYEDTNWQPGEPVFPTLPYGLNRPVSASDYVTHGIIQVVQPNSELLYMGFGRTLDIKPASNQYQDVLDIENLVLNTGSTGPGVWKGGHVCIPNVRFAVWSDAPLILEAGSFAHGLLLPLHPELLNGNGNAGVALP